jgi:hypothetical protein
MLTSKLDLKLPAASLKRLSHQFESGLKWNDVKKIIRRGEADIFKIFQCAFDFLLI